MRHQIFLLMSFFSQLTAVTPKEDVLYHNTQDDVLHVFSYPRSGTNFLVSLLTELSQRKAGHYGRLHNSAWNPLNLPIDTNLPPVFVVHYPDHISSLIDNESHLLIALVRNFKENGTRNLYDLNTNSSQSIQELLKNTSSFPILKKFIMGKTIDKRNYLPYFEILNIYDSWPEDKRLLIYYENLITHPEKEAKRIAAFLSLNEENLVERVNHLQQKILENFSNRHKSYTSGKDLLAYSKKLSKEEHYFLDNYVKSTYPVLWEKYLSRYSFENTMK